jgi:isopenicillin-N N-acyltransferase-like protein
VSASSAITLAAAEADTAALVAVELSPDGAGVVWPDADGLLAHANHFLALPGSAHDTQPAESPSTLLRAWQLRRLVEQGTPFEESLCSHFPAGEGICRHVAAETPWADRYATLLAFIADPAEPALKISDGPPCETPFVDVPLPWT